MPDPERLHPLEAGEDARWAREPLGVWWGAPQTLTELGAVFRRFEFSSRGDRVTGALVWPKAVARPVGTVLVASDERVAPQGARLAGGVRALLERGLAAAALGLPLLGDRASPKLSALLHRAFDTPDRSREEPLLEELLRGAAQQARWDLERARLVLDRERSVASGPIALLAVGAGAALVEPILGALASLRHVALVRPRASPFPEIRHRPPQVPGIEIRIESELDAAAAWLAERLGGSPR